MSIEESDFKLTPATNDAGNFWDLEVLVTVKPKSGGELRKEFKLIAYGVTIDSAIRRIANYRILHNNKDAALTMQEYLKQYREQINKIDNLCKITKKEFIDEND